MSCEVLFEEAKRLHRRVYFWTFTFPDAEAHWCVSKAWNRFSGKLWEKYTSQDFMALRVWEVHPSEFSHGLHVHMLCNERISIHLMRRLCAHYGLGHCWVRQAHAEPWRGKDGQVYPSDLDYTAKYIGKMNMRPQHVHVWSKLGAWEHVKCSDLEFQSAQAADFRDANQRLRGMGMDARQAWGFARVMINGRTRGGSHVRTS